MENQNESAVSANATPATDPNDSEYTCTNALKKLAAAIAGSSMGRLVVDEWLHEKEFLLVHKPEVYEEWRREEKQAPAPKISARKRSEWDKADDFVLSSLAGVIANEIPEFAFRIVREWCEKSNAYLVDKQYYDAARGYSGLDCEPTEQENNRPEQLTAEENQARYIASLDAMIDDPGFTLIQDIIARWREKGELKQTSN